MGDYSVAEAEDRIEELIDRALAGEDVVIMRGGKPVAEIRPIPEPPLPPRPITAADLDWLAERRVGRGRPTVDAGTLLSQMRDEDWK